MYSVIVFVSIAACISTVYSAVALLPPMEKPEEMAQQDGCYVPQLTKVLPYNTPYSPQDGTSCVQYTCQEDNVTTIFTCGSLAVVSDDCAIVSGDMFLPYPDCCNKITCNIINHKSITT